jgi:hypothetical protein
MMSKNVKITDSFAHKIYPDTVVKTTIHPKYLHLYPEEAKNEEICFLSGLEYDGETYFPILVPPTGVSMGAYPPIITGPKYIQVQYKHTVRYITHYSPLGKTLNGRS